MNLKVEELCSVVRGRFLNKGSPACFTGVSIDSRDPDLKEKIFFAIKGSRFDGHDFLNQALKAGAGALIVHKELSIDSRSTAVIQVEDTLKALHNLAAHWRNKIKARVIGITGSAGKTTTKNFCRALLESSFSVIASPKSFNNMYGVPLTVLSAKEDTDILIQEIGMNQVGEIKELSRLVRPNIAVVTQVGYSHIGILGSREKIAREKEEIYINSPEAVPVFNWDDSYTRAMYERRAKKKQNPPAVCFSSQDEKADVFLQIKQIEKCGLSISGHLGGVRGASSAPIAGPAHLNNLMAGAGLALAAGLEGDQIWERFSLCHLPAGRNEWSTLSSGARALFDAYNASPESVMALLEYFLSPVVTGKKFLILGDFLELGLYLESFQKQVAEKLAQSEVSLIWFIGAQGGGFAKALKKADCTAELYFSEHFAPRLAKKILSMLNPSVTLAFKASRKARLEDVLLYFQSHS